MRGASHRAPVYAASKAAVVRFTAALAPLGRRLNIRVNCICPDWVDTPSVQRTRAAMSPEEWRAMTPAVMTKPEEIAEAVLTIISDETLAGRVMLWVSLPRRQNPALLRHSWRRRRKELPNLLLETFG